MSYNLDQPHELGRVSHLIKNWIDFASHQISHHSHSNSLSHTIKFNKWQNGFFIRSSTSWRLELFHEAARIHYLPMTRWKYCEKQQINPVSGNNFYAVWSSKIFQPHPIFIREATHDHKHMRKDPFSNFGCWINYLPCRLIEELCVQWSAHTARNSPQSFWVPYVRASWFVPSGMGRTHCWWCRRPNLCINRTRPGWTDSVVAALHSFLISGPISKANSLMTK